MRCFALLAGLLVCMAVPLNLEPIAAAPNPEPAAVGEWPQWRGPKRDGVAVEKDLLKEWPKDGPKLLWEVETCGNGYSSIAIAGGRIYTLGDRSGDAMLIAMDLKDGKEKWATKIGGKYSESRMPGGAGGPRGTPSVSGDLIFAIAPHGEFVCVNSEGKEQWRKDFGKDFGGEEPKWGFCESPLVDGDLVIASPGGRDAGIVAFKKKDGEVVWKSKIGDAAHYSSMIAAEVGGIRQYIQLMSKGIVSVAAKDGKVLWRYDRASVKGMGANVPTAIVKDEFVFCVTGYKTGGGLVKLIVDKDSVSAKEEYFERDLTNKHGGVVLVGDHLYGDRDEGGMVYCAEFKSGKMMWEKAKQDRPSGSGSAAIVAADNLLFIRYGDGTNVLVPCDPKQYKETGSFKTPHKIRSDKAWAHPVVADGKLYIREQKWLMCYDIKAK